MVYDIDREKNNDETMKRPCSVGAMAGGGYLVMLRYCAKRSARLARSPVIEQSLTNHCIICRCLINVHSMLIFNAASLLTLSGMEEAMKLTVNYCRQRKTFGKPLIQNQWIHFKLAELQAADLMGSSTSPTTVCANWLRGKT